MRNFAFFVLLSFGLVGAAKAGVNLQITEIYGGTTNTAGVGPELGIDIPEWFEITNFGDTAADLVANPLYYDDESADPAKNNRLADVDSIAPGESVIFFVDFESDFPGATPEEQLEAAYTNFELAWGELPGIQIGYVADHGGGLGGKGDTIYIFDGNTSSANIVDSEGYGNHEPKLIESTHVSLPDGTWRGWDNDVPEHDVYTNTDLAGFGGGTLGSLGYGLAGRTALVPIGNQWSAEQAALDPGGDGYWYVTLIGSPGLVSTVVGDANCDGCVNSADLDIVRSELGSERRRRPCNGAIPTWTASSTPETWISSAPTGDAPRPPRPFPNRQPSC